MGFEGTVTVCSTLALRFPRGEDEGDSKEQLALSTDFNNLPKAQLLVLTNV